MSLSNAGIWAAMVFGVAGTVLGVVNLVYADTAQTIAAIGHRPVLGDVSPGTEQEKIVYDRELISPQEFTLEQSGTTHLGAFPTKDGLLYPARSVVLKNWGTGPARIREVRLIISGLPASHEPRAWAVPEVVPAGESVRLLSLVGGYTIYDASEDQVAIDAEKTPFRIEVDYTDIRGGQPQRSIVRFESTYPAATLRQLPVETTDL